MIDVQPVTFNIKIVGETTSQEYVGSFKVRPVLTQAEQLQRDGIMRDLLGGRASEASPRAVSQALLLAEIQVRSLDTPMFWKEAKNGLALFDENVMGTVYDRIQEVEKEWRADMAKKAADAKKALTDMSDSPK